MAIETKSTTGGELVYKQNKSTYVGQYYIQDGKIYAGNPNSGVTGANNGKNPNQQTELIRVSNQNRSDDGYIKAPFGEEQNFPFNLQQDIYETVPEIIDTEVSELKPQSVDNLTPEQILQNRITEMFKEYADLRDRIDGLGAERSHNFLVNSSLPYTEQLDTINELIENIPSYVVNDTGSVDGFVRETTTENLETTFEESDFQPGSVRNTKRNLEIEQLQHERGDDVDSANIDHLTNLITQLEAEIERLKGLADTAEAARASLEQQLEGTLAILNEDEEETLGEILDDPGKDEVVWEEKFPFEAKPEIEPGMSWRDLPFAEGWNSSSLKNYVIPNGGFEGRGGIRLLRKSPTGVNGKQFSTSFFLKANQTYTFSCYIRFGTMKKVRIWIGDGVRPGKPNYMPGSEGPYDWKYSWTAYVDINEGQVENSSGRYKFEEINYEVPHGYDPGSVRFKNFLQPMSGSNKFDGTAIIDGVDEEQYKYTADSDGKWYRLEFDFTPQQNIYQGRRLTGYPDDDRFDDDIYQGAPYCRTTLILYEGMSNHEYGDYVEWSDLKVFRRKESHFNPQPYTDSEYLINKPFANGGIDDRTLQGRMYESDRYVAGVMNTADITKYRVWPPNWTFQDTEGGNWAFASNVGVWTDAGLLGQAGAGNEPADVSWNYGVNLLNNFDYSITTGGGGDSLVPQFWNDIRVLDTDANSNAKTSAPGQYPGVAVNSFLQVSGQGSYYVLNGGGDGRLQSAVNNAKPGEEAHVDNYKFNNNLVKIDWNSGGSDGYVWGFYQDVDITGAGGVAYFKLGAYTGGISNQNDNSMCWVRFFDENDNIVVPDNPLTRVIQETVLSDWEDDSDTSPSYATKQISFNGVSQNMRMSSYRSPTNSEAGYSGGSGNYWGINYYAFSTDINTEGERGFDGIWWSGCSTKVPPNATRARVYVVSQKKEGDDGDGYVGPVLFKLYDSLQNPGTIDLI